MFGEPFLFVSNFKFLYLYPTMDGLWKQYTCAYCGEPNETFIDPTSGVRQSYVQDCAVCCNPNVLAVQFHPSTGAVVIEAVIEE